MRVRWLRTRRQLQAEKDHFEAEMERARAARDRLEVVYMELRQLVKERARG